MSQLALTNTRYGTRKLNVLSFNSPITGQLGAAQTKTRMQYFPIKALQPELQLDVIFRSEAEYQNFQRYVRDVQVDAQRSGDPSVKLWWPERSIYNWTGIIKDFRAGGRRANYAPRAQFVIELVDSLVSERTNVSSLASSWQEVFGVNTPGGVLSSVIGAVGATVEALLQPPAPINDTIGIITDVTNVNGAGGSGGGFSW